MTIQIILFLFLILELYLVRNFHKLRIRSYVKMSYTLLSFIALLSIFSPMLLQDIAEIVGVGRGADLLLYLISVAFIGFVGLSLAKHREVDLRLMAIARYQALKNANHFEG